MSEPHKAITIDRLTLSGFRNYHALRLETRAETIALTGPNGAGKTNLLEAISMLTPGRGLRSAAMHDLAHQSASSPSDQHGWAVAATLTSIQGETRLGTSWKAASPAEQETLSSPTQTRQLQINGTIQRSLNGLDDHIRILWLTPAMDRLFTGPASDRRRFLDRLVLAYDSEHGRHINAFERAMRERNRLLAESRQEVAWLDAVELQLAEHGVAAAAARRTTVKALNQHIASHAASDAPFPWAEIAMDGLLETDLATIPAVQAEDKYRKMLADSRNHDRITARTQQGPHRSDLVVIHGPKQTAARLCSTGEQKALLTGIVLAHAHMVKRAFDGWAPILLLDEVTAHLDASRRTGLFEELAKLGGQSWMSGTDHALFAEIADNAHIFNVIDGHISPITR